MDYAAFAEQVRQKDYSAVRTLSENEHQAFAEYLKTQVETHWGGDTDLALQYAEAMITIGQLWENTGIIALGTMARGDTLRLRGQSQDAWDNLEQAAELFEEAGDSIGAARTWIGRLALSPSLQRIDTAIQQAKLARQKLADAQEILYILRLDINLAYLYLIQGNLHEALDIILPAIDLAQASGEQYESQCCHLYANAGYAYTHLTQFDKAEAYYLKARTLYIQMDAPSNSAMTDLNRARLAEYRSDYAQALKLRMQAAELLKANNQSRYFIVAQYEIMRSFFQTNRLEDAYASGQLLLHQPQITEMSETHAHVLTLFALVQANQQSFANLDSLLIEAEALYEQLGATNYIGILYLYRAQALILQSEYELATPLAERAATILKDTDLLNYGQCIVLLSQIAMVHKHFDSAREHALEGLQLAKEFNLALLRYQAYLQLGKIHKALNEQNRAVRYFQSANATINRVQQRLTMPLRSDFMRDKDEAFRELMDIYINNNQADLAFELLERHKSRVFWAYLVQGNNLSWALDSVENQDLFEKLQTLRSQHHYYYQQLHQPFGEQKTLSPERESELKNMIRDYEQQIRAITDRLYLQSHNHQSSAFRLPTLKDIQAEIPQNTLLIEYFDDGTCLWVFAVSRDSVVLHELDTSVADVNRLLQQWQLNIGSVLKVGVNASLSRPLTKIGQRILDNLYQALLAPLQDTLTHDQHLVIVPYGVLHYLPFHLLRHDGRYLIEDYEMRLLPSASLLVRDLPKQEGGARIIGHSANGNLPATLTEAEQVYSLFGGEQYTEQAATREALMQAPCQILHIAAHGQFRLDFPSLSFIALADGQLNADDLLQQDMRYELVTLSACETARATIVPGDELIGLGRGFLYAGAGAILANLWQADDTTTARVIFAFYTALKQGKRKSFALQSAMTTILNEDTSLHPAFWGSLQLMGDAHALSTIGN